MVEKKYIEPTVVIRGDYKETLFCDIMISEKILQERTILSKVLTY